LSEERGAAFIFNQAITLKLVQFGFVVPRVSAHRVSEALEGDRMTGEERENSLVQTIKKKVKGIALVLPELN
jgi:hypothetical protein